MIVRSGRGEMSRLKQETVKVLGELGQKIRRLRAEKEALVKEVGKYGLVGSDAKKVLERVKAGNGGKVGNGAKIPAKVLEKAKDNGVEFSESSVEQVRLLGKKIKAVEKVIAEREDEVRKVQEEFKARKRQWNTENVRRDRATMKRKAVEKVKEFVEKKAKVVGKGTDGAGKGAGEVPDPVSWRGMDVNMGVVVTEEGEIGLFDADLALRLKGIKEKGEKDGLLGLLGAKSALNGQTPGMQKRYKAKPGDVGKPKWTQELKAEREMREGRIPKTLVGMRELFSDRGRLEQAVELLVERKGQWSGMDEELGLAKGVSKRLYEEWLKPKLQERVGMVVGSVVQPSVEDEEVNNYTEEDDGVDIDNDARTHAHTYAGKNAGPVPSSQVSRLEQLKQQTEHQLVEHEPQPRPTSTPTPPSASKLFGEAMRSRTVLARQKLVTETLDEAQRKQLAHELESASVSAVEQIMQRLAYRQKRRDQWMAKAEEEGQYRVLSSLDTGELDDMKFAVGLTGLDRTVKQAEQMTPEQSGVTNVMMVRMDGVEGAGGRTVDMVRAGGVGGGVGGGRRLLPRPGFVASKTDVTGKVSVTGDEEIPQETTSTGTDLGNDELPYSKPETMSQRLDPTTFPLDIGNDDDTGNEEERLTGMGRIERIQVEE